VETVSGVALVVGGASGIGLASAEALNAAGWHTIVADLRPDPEMPDAVAVDVRDRDGVEAAVTDVVDRHGELGAVVYAAGTARVTPLLEIAEREWDLVLGVNLTGAFNVIQACAAAMPRGGSITIISSVDSQAPVAGLAHYSAAKAGGEALIRCAALELGPRAIRCNAVLPGVVRTPLMAPMLDRPGMTESFIERTPLGRVAEGGDIADVVAFLASPAARWITGVSLPVDGGMSLREHPVLLAQTPVSANPAS
jgi:3-oxoacyl-[acyl-carrier protein] reductase